MLLPLGAEGQTLYGTVHELAGRVLLNGRPLTRDSVIQPGQTVSTGSDGRIWFTVAGDSFVLRPNTELRLSPSVRDSIVQGLRLVTGAFGATFRRGGPRSLVAQTVTIGIRGTGVFVETNDETTYVCTCFGAIELDAGGEPAAVRATHHNARRVSRDGRIVEAPMQNHTDEELSRLERLAGRPYPF